MAFYDQLNSFFTGDTEEERRRREEEERLRIERETPVKQTVEIDPATGAQKVKIEGSAYNLSSANPLTPTISGPVAPVELAPVVDQSRKLPEGYLGTVGFNPNAAPINPSAPVATNQSNVVTPDELERRYQESQRLKAQTQPTELNQLPQGVSSAAALQPTAPVAPQKSITRPVMIAGTPTSDVGLTPTEQALKQQNVPVTPTAVTTTAPTAEGLSMGPSTSAMTETAWADRFISAQKNPNQMASLQADPNQPEWLRRLAAEENYNTIKQQKDQQRVETKVTKAIETGDMLGLAREIKKSGEEGSIIKAYLYSRFGLNDLAKEEQQKLGAGLRWETSVDSKGNAALIQYSGDGLPLKGYDPTGKELTTDQLAGYTGSSSQKAFLMPSAHGSPVVKEVIGPDGKKQQIGGIRMYDPRTKQAYVQVGNERQSDVGWVTTGQAPTAVYTASGAKQQGTQAAQGFVNQPLPPMPGGVSAPSVPTAPVVEEASVSTTPAPVRTTPAPARTTPTPVVATQATPGIPSAGSEAPAAGGGMPVFKQQKESERTTKRSESFDKIIDTEYREGAAAGEIISNNRKTQFQILDRVDPTSGKKMGQIITGIYNADNEHPGDQKWTLVRDLLLSKTAAPEDEISKRVARLNLSPEAKSALIEYIGLNGAIAAKTLKETAGPGSVSDAEQQANRARNVDIGKTPMLGTYNMMAQSQFDADIQRYKADLATSPNNTATNATQFDRNFRRTQAELVKTYREIAEKRIDYMRQNGFTPDAIRDGYKKFPVPEYDPTTGNWKKLKPLAEIMK